MPRLSNSIKALIPIIMLALASIACMQDCMGITFYITGYVVDENNNPISNATIRAWDSSSLDFTVTSNHDGYFATDSTFSYACYKFKVEVSAEGYQTKTLAYYPPGEGFSDELPSSITVQLKQR